MELGSPHIELEREKRSDYGLNIPIDLNVLFDGVYVKRKAPVWIEDSLRKLMDNQGLNDVPIQRSEI